MTTDEARQRALRIAAERFVPLDPANLVVTRQRIWPFSVYWDVRTETSGGLTRITLRDRDGEWIYFGLRSRRRPVSRRRVMAITAWLIAFAGFVGWAIHRFLGGTLPQSILVAPVVAWFVTILALPRLTEFLRRRQPPLGDDKPRPVFEENTGQHNESE